MTAELLRALACICEGAGDEQSRVLSALGVKSAADPVEFTELFTFTLYPYASVYLGPEGMLGGEARDRIAGFWRALALDPPAEPDHLASLLALYARLVEDAASQHDRASRLLTGHAKNALLWEHLASWLPVYLARVRELASPAYAGWAEVLEAALLDEIARAEPPARQPVHLMQAPPLPDPRSAGADAFLAALLAPVRSGFIVTRHDLAIAAQSMGAGLRQGERKYLMTRMFGHDSGAMLSWLRQMARQASISHSALPAQWGAARAFWIERANAAHRLFSELAGEQTPVVSQPA
jgi:TorA maturation chaperone TorD